MSARNLLLTLVAVLALAAIACGGGGEVVAPQTTAATETAAVTASPGIETPSPAPVELYPVTVTDSNGREVKVELPPQRIIALAPSFVEIFFAIGAGNSVVAVDENTDFPEEAAALTKLSGFQPSVEGIAALNPDLVLIFFDPGGLQEALERLGIPVLFLAFPSSVEEVFDQIELLGRVTGHEDEAEAVAAEMRDGIDEIIGKLAGLDQGPSIFHELTTDLWTVGPGSFVHDLYTLLKVENIAEATGLPATQMSAEAIIEADPEVIILADAEFGDSPETVAARPGWSNMAAVRNGRIYAVDPDIVSQPGPRLVEGLETLARLLYPERFQ